jgi:hypothetical protein
MSTSSLLLLSAVTFFVSLVIELYRAVRFRQAATATLSKGFSFSYYLVTEIEGPFYDIVIMIV